MTNLPTANNNPGNLRGTDGQFIKFGAPIEGQAALYNDLTAKMTGKSKTGLSPKSTLFDFASKYAPKEDGNDPASYAANIANELKISPDDSIGSLVPRIDEFAHAIAKHEGYKGVWSGGTSGASNFNPKPYSNPKPGDEFTTKSLVSNNTEKPGAFKQALNFTTKGLGMQPFGQGIATAYQEITGNGNQGIDAEAQAAKDISSYASLPVGSPERKLAFQKYQQRYAGGITSQAEIDPGTTLKDSDVIESATKTGLLALSGASGATKGMQSGKIAQKAVAGIPQIGAKVSEINSPLLFQAIKNGGKSAIPLISKIAPFVGKLANAGIGLGVLKELYELNNKK